MKFKEKQGAQGGVRERQRKKKRLKGPRRPRHQNSVGSIALNLSLPPLSLASLPIHPLSLSMKPPKREAPEPADFLLPKKSSRPRREAEQSKSSMATKKEVEVELEEKDLNNPDPKNSKNADNDGPFPTWRRPSPAECFAARDALALIHGEPGSIPLSPPTSPSTSPSFPSPNGTSSSKAFSDPNGCHNDCLSVLDSLVRTILSQNTTDATSVRAFRALKAALPTWEQTRTAPLGVMEEAIRVGGLAEIKAARIRVILETIRAEALAKMNGGSGGGATKEEKDEKKKKKASAAAAPSSPSDFDFNNSLLSLEYLREWPDAEEIKAELVRFNGVGPKTAGETKKKSFYVFCFLFFLLLFLYLSHPFLCLLLFLYLSSSSKQQQYKACVVLFALKRADFPVDTHIQRIAAALGWTPRNSSREQSYEHLRRKVPASVVHDLHVLLVAHGKVCRRCMSAGRGGGGGGEKCAMRAAVAEAAAAEAEVKEEVE